MRYHSFLALALVGLTACSSGPALEPVPADRPILLWYGDSTTTQAADLLAETGFTGPDQHACSADPTRQYIGELFAHGIDDVQVPWHWAPVIPGPDPAHPTVDQPEFFIAGALEDVVDSGDDVLADHPFGLDVNSNLLADPDYAFLAPETGALHTEIEMRIFPRTALGFEPRAGDRALMKGVWVLDCGHPPYGTEMHPPTFVNYARADDSVTTISAAMVAPYRSSLLFNPNAALATDFGNTTRFASSQSAPFSTALINAVVQAALTNADHLAAPALMVANHFDTLDWMVCAPLPQPAGTSMDAHWRFTMRTGVHVRATPIRSAGCVRFTATMDPDYVPAPLPHVSAPWSWDELSASASSEAGTTIDVRQAILDALSAQGIDASTVPAFMADHPPQIDSYPTLELRPGADQDMPTQLEENADDQPFPFYGRVRVGWR